MFRLVLRMPQTRLIRRPRRPPDISPPKVRFFARNSQLLLLSARQPRPQLPFLLSAHRSKAQWRWISTEKQQHYKEQAWIVTKQSTAICLALVCLTITGYGVVQSILEREHPTPPDWSFWTRTNYRSAIGQQKEDAHQSGAVDWAAVGSLYRRVLRRLEDPHIDGAGLLEHEEGGIDIPGAGRAGFDLSEKSKAWCQGYYETLMGCAKAAEHLDGDVVDTTTNAVYKACFVIGPSNPEPKTLPPSWQQYAPLEENCKPACPPPEHYYVQILTTRGFTPKQRLDAAIAYADWLDFKGLHSTAGEMLKWAVDIAESHTTAKPIFNASHRVDEKLTSLVSDNQLVALTALATHHALTGEVSKALSEYLSVLQQRRAAPMVPDTATELQYAKIETPAATDLEVMSRWWRNFLSLISDPAYPITPSAQFDEPLVRRPRDGSICEEAKLETYIGEILFATATSEKRKADAIRWTRDALEKADQPMQDQGLPLPVRLKCLSCVEVSLSNWLTMVRRMAEDESEGKLTTTSFLHGWVPRSWKRRFGYVTAPADGTEETVAGRWQLERAEAEKRRLLVNRQGMREKLTNSVWQPFWVRVGWLMQT